MKFDNAAWFRRGIQNGVPIALGYLAVSFTLGIAARNPLVLAGLERLYRGFLRVRPRLQVVVRQLERRQRRRRAS